MVVPVVELDCDTCVPPLVEFVVLEYQVTVIGNGFPRPVPALHVEKSTDNSDETSPWQ